VSRKRQLRVELHATARLAVLRRERARYRAKRRRRLLSDDDATVSIRVNNVRTLTAAMNGIGGGLTICVDLTGVDALRAADMKRAAQQLMHVWAVQKVCASHASLVIVPPQTSVRPACLHVCAANTDGPFWQMCRRRYDGFGQYKWNVHSTPPTISGMFAPHVKLVNVSSQYEPHLPPLTAIGACTSVLTIVCDVRAA
jgi:hypothetical protein